MKLIDDWRQSWRLWSVRASAFGLIASTAIAAAPDALLSVWQSLPDELRVLVPDALGRWIPAVLFVASIGARVIRQREQHNGE